MEFGATEGRPQRQSAIFITSRTRPVSMLIVMAGVALDHLAEVLSTKCLSSIFPFSPLPSCPLLEEVTGHIAHT